MSFQIVEKSLDGLEVIEIKNRLNGEYVNIVPGHGGVINEVVFNKKGTLHAIHKCEKSLLEFQEKSVPLYAGAFLAPFPNRIKEGRYQFNEIAHILELNDKGFDNALHGFLYKAPFSTCHIDKNLGTLSLETHFNGAIGYPFQLYFKNSYHLKERELIVTSYVRNESGTIVPFGMGWHPYIATGTSVDLLQLKTPGKKMFEQNSQHIPTGKILENRNFLEKSVISDRFINDCYILENNDQTHIYDAQKDLNIVIAQQTGEKAYNYCMYYTPPERDCLAVEPMTAAPNAFNNGHGSIILSKGEEIEIFFSIALDE